MSDSPFPFISLGTVCTKIGSGVTPKGGESVYIEDGVALIRSQNVYNAKFETEGLAHITDDQAEKMSGVEVEPKDVLLNITGDSVARCCSVPDEILPARVNQHVSIIRPDPKKIDPQFLTYFFVSPFMQSTMLSLAGSGGTRKALTKAMIEDFRVPCPKLEMQRRIASILSAYDDLIANNRRRIQLLEQAARHIYKEWFVRLRFPGHERTRVVDGVPKGWEKKTLADICDDIRDSIEPGQVESDTPYVGLEHIPKKSITLSEWGQADDVTSSKFRFVEGDILFGKIRPYFHKVGFTLTNGITSIDTIVIRANDEKFYAYLLMLVSSDEFVAVASKTMREGSKMPRADWNFMKQYAVLIPPAPILSEFDKIIDDIVKQLKTLALQSKKLQQARDILLPRLMSGDISV